MKTSVFAWHYTHTHANPLTCAGMHARLNTYDWFFGAFLCKKSMVFKWPKKKHKNNQTDRPKNKLKRLRPNLRAGHKSHTQTHA